MTNSAKEEVAELLNIPISDEWDIYNQDEKSGIFLIHYNVNDGAYMVPYGNLKGTVVDLAKKRIICQSFGYTPTATIDKLEYDDFDNLRLTDDYGNLYQIAKGTCSLRRSFEGVVIRVFKYGGEVYFATHKCLHPTRSRWGTSEPFLVMYDKLGGPSGSDLFDVTETESPYCYIFLVVHPDLLVGSQENVGDGYIVHLETRKMSWSTTGVERKLNVSSTLPVTKGTLYQPPFLSLDEANDILQYGMHSELKRVKLFDDRLGTGESIMLATDKVMIKINSPSYAWRINLRNDNHNLKHQFFMLSNSARLDTSNKASLENFKEYYPLVAVPDVKLVRDDLSKGFIDIKMLTDTKNLNQRDRLAIVWYNYLISVPTSQRSKVVDLLDTYYKERKEVTDWVISIFEVTPNQDVPRAQNIIKQARKITSSSYRNNSRKSFDNTIKDNIKVVINSLFGAKLYQLIKERYFYFNPRSTTER